MWCRPSIFLGKITVGFKNCLPPYNLFDLAKVLSFWLFNYGASGSMKVGFRGGMQSWWQIFTNVGEGIGFVETV